MTCKTVITWAVSKSRSSPVSYKLGYEGAEPSYKALGMTPHKPQAPHCDQNVKSTIITYLAGCRADRMFLCKEWA